MDWSPVKRFAILTTIAAATVALAACGSASGPRSDRTAAPSAEGGGTPAGASGGTLITRATAAPPGSPDPQINYSQQEWQFLIMTHDGLVGFKRAGGAEGTKIVPDLAAAIPTPTEGGRTWRFTLRPGIRFSDGKPVTARDVQATFERMFKLRSSPNAGTWYGVIAGAASCIERPKTCDLSHGVAVDGDAVTFHLTRSDPEFLQKLAMPFAFVLPASTPARSAQIPPPGTGPYKWMEYSPQTRIKIVRNPYFREWSKDAQPAGLPDAIEQRFGLTVDAAVTQVAHGHVDWSYDPIPADRLPELDERYGDQLHVNPVSSTWYFAFNTRVPPFNNAKARQAINFATDRAALVKIFGGPQLATPTCQVLPRNFPGFAPYCPYTANPGQKWTAPDLANARRLVRESGTAGARVKVTSDTTEIGKSLGTYFVDLLDKLGYRSSAQFLSPSVQYGYSANSKNRAQLSFGSWLADYPAASDFLQVLLGCGSFQPSSASNPNLAAFCDRGVQARMDRAGAVGAVDPQAANRMWASADRAVTDRAPWVAMFNPTIVDFVSKRVRNVQFSPQWFFLLDQASVS
jgi:peptide/nickel transport system substrate-binding protein